MDPGGVYPPGLAIALLVLAFNALGDSLSDVL
jgi:ABC-type dipeptide/oligopeptide/nickel transport system permease subunit